MRERHKWSLQTRVGLLLLFAIFAGLLVGAVAVYRAATIEVEQLTHERLESLAQELLSNATRNGLSHQPNGFKYDETTDPSSLDSGAYIYQIWQGDGSRLLASHHVSAAEPLVPLQFTGFRSFTIDKESHVLYAAVSPDKQLLVQVADRAPDLFVPIGLISWPYFAFVALPMALLWAFTRVLLKKSFSPLNRLAKNLENRGPNDTNTTLIESPPDELLPIISALDALFRRVDNAMSVEQRFTAVAAHELRTPLAGIRAQSQIARSAENKAELTEALNSVQLGVDNATRVIEQLLDLTRIESMSSSVESQAQRIQFASIYAQVIEELKAKVRLKKITIETDFKSEQVQGYDFAIYLLMRNLIANAIQYCPESQRIEIHSWTENNSVILVVDDSGRGIPEAERERAFQKFNRLGQTDSTGVGLGLSIAANVAKLHGAKIELLKAPIGGLRAKVVFRPQA